MFNTFQNPFQPPTLPSNSPQPVVQPTGVPPASGAETVVSRKPWWQLTAVTFPAIPIGAPFGGAAFTYNDQFYDLFIDKTALMISATVAAQVVDPALFGYRMRIGQGGRIAAPPLGNMPTRFADTDPINAWLHPTLQWIDVIPDGAPLQFSNGDTIWNEFFNAHANPVTVSFRVQGHFERAGAAGRAAGVTTQ